MIDKPVGMSPALETPVQWEHRTPATGLIRRLRRGSSRRRSRAQVGAGAWRARLGRRVHPAAHGAPRPLAYLSGLALVALTTLAGKLLGPYHLGNNLIEVTLLYLMVVLFLAVRSGLWPSLVAAVAGVATLDYFFMPPLYSFYVATPQDVVLLGFFGVVAMTASSLASRSRSQMLIARRHAETRAEICAFAGRLAATVTLEATVATAVEQIAAMLGRCADIRLGAETLDKSAELLLPLRTGSETIGVMRLEPKDGAGLTREDRDLLDALGELTAIAIGRQLLAERLARLGIEREADRLRSALLNSFAHDLTAPIATLASVLSSLDTSYNAFDDAARRELIAEAGREAGHLHRFSANLVNMTRLEAGTIDLRREAVTVDELVGGALARARGLLAPRPIVLDLPADLPPLRADVVLLQQVVFNLLENAAKYTPPDATVTISARTGEDDGGGGGDLVLRIADSGPGIAADDNERIFTKFYRGRHTVGDARGTGLGLAICRGFVEAHGGTISAANRTDGRGAVFTIKLPAGQRVAACAGRSAALVGRGSSRHCDRL